MAIRIYILKITLYKMIKSSNSLKTQTGWMDMKIRPINTHSTRDPLQIQGHMHTESKGMETYFMQVKSLEARLVILELGKIDLKSFERD